VRFLQVKYLLSKQRKEGNAVGQIMPAMLTMYWVEEQKAEKSKIRNVHVAPRLPFSALTDKNRKEVKEPKLTSELESEVERLKGDAQSHKKEKEMVEKTPEAMQKLLEDIQHELQRCDEGNKEWEDYEKGLLLCDQQRQAIQEGLLNCDQQHQMIQDDLHSSQYDSEAKEVENDGASSEKYEQREGICLAAERKFQKISILYHR
jgi:hypothetical protein